MSDSASEKDALTPLEESKTDSHETRMTYSPGSHLPLFVVAIWALVLIGLGAYFFIHYLTDLRKWGAP